MLFYGQKNYSEKMGNGNYTVAEIGCLLTADCNLMQKFGETITPATLNTYYTSHNVYLADPADGKGVKDDLSWGSITAYDPTITVTATGSGSWPNSDNAIIEFIYQSIQEPWLNAEHTEKNMVTHFCAVESVANKTIIDSWDGNIKQPGVYGAPVAWAAYAKNFPQVITKPQSATPIAAPNAGSYITVTLLKGYVTAADAARRVASNSTVPIGNYAIFNQADGMINITREAGKPGWWINPGDNIAGKGEGVGSNAPLPFTLDTNDAGMYRANSTITIVDQANPAGKTLVLKSATSVKVAGEFTGTDGLPYFLPQFAKNSGTWYAIPTHALTLLQVPYNPPKLTLYGHLLKAVAGIVGVFNRRKMPDA